MTVGRAEVAMKRREWDALGKKAREVELAQHWFPSVVGPKGRYYIVDHHHLGLALQEEGVQECSLIVLQDYSSLDTKRFWRVMEFHDWAHPYDAKGRRWDFEAIPKRLSDLQDDPYRSLAGFVRLAGGYAKDTTPYSEFLWADLFRLKISQKLMQRSRAAAIKKAVKLARSEQASYLPGWTGVAGPGHSKQ
jgi:hypothetical protein